MLRATVYNEDGNRNQLSIQNERIYRSAADWDLKDNMKLWFEHPESTRFARSNYDILYTPIFFANEGITGNLCLEEKSEHASSFMGHHAEVYVKGVASLGILSIAGRPANIYDTRYALPHVGFRSILTLETLNLFDTLTLDANPYEREGVIGRKIPFSFPLPAETLQQLRELAPSLKSISSDTHTTVDVLRETSPTMMINVRYVLEAYLVQGNATKQKIEQEIRIFVALDQDNVPSPLPEITEAVHQHRRSSMVELKNRRTAILPGRRKSVREGTDYVIIETDEPEPFAFQTHSDAAATRLRISLTYSGGPETSETPPSAVQGNIEWFLRSLTSIAIQAHDREEEPAADPAEDAFHMRTKHLPLRKLKMVWSDWQKVGPDEGLARAWRATQDLWLTEPTMSALTPTFRTSYLSHTYSLAMQIAVSGKSFKSQSYKVDLNIPVRIRYDIGLAPTYSIDQSLPQYTVDEADPAQHAGHDGVGGRDAPPAFEDHFPHAPPAATLDAQAVAEVAAEAQAAASREALPDTVPAAVETPASNGPSMQTST